MLLSDAQAMVAQFDFGAATREQLEAIAIHMVATGASVYHAAWELYGRVRGFPCTCAPCMADPPIGSEVVVRILMQGQGFEGAPMMQPQTESS